MMIKNKTFLVTGASGFVGYNVVRYLANRGADVVACYNRRGIELQELADEFPSVTPARVDLLSRDWMTVLSNHFLAGIDYALHFAAHSTISEAFRHPMGVVLNNVEMTVKVAEACRLHDVPMLYMSSDKFYGGSPRFGAKNAFNATEAYSASKVACDAIIQSYIRSHGLRGVIIRPCNLFGFDKNFTRIMPNIMKAIITGEPVRIYKQTKDVTRTYMFIDDFCEVVGWIIEADHGGILDVAPPEPVLRDYYKSTEDLVNAVGSVLKKPVPRIYVDAPELVTVPKSQRMTTNVRIRHYTPFDVAVQATHERYVNWYRSRHGTVDDDVT